MTLHEEIIDILREAGKPLTFQEIANKVNQRGNYEQLDGTAISPKLIQTKVKRYPQFFILVEGKVSLIDWEELGEIRDVLISARKSLTTKEIAEFINQKKQNLDEKTTPGQVLLRLKRYTELFNIMGDEIELREMPEFNELDNDVKKKEKIYSSDRAETNILRTISLGNFKAFRDTQEIKIRPLTLIFGPNSSGKSSIIHSMLLIQNAFTTGDLDPHYMDISGQSVDLGGFKQFVYHKKNDNQIRWGIKFSTLEFSKRLKETLSGVNEIEINILIGQKLKEKRPGDLTPFGKPRITLYEVKFNGEEFIRLSLKTESRLTVDSLNVNIEVMKNILEAIILANTTTDQISDVDYSKLLNVLKDLVPNLFCEGYKFLPSSFNKIDQEQDFSILSLQMISKDNREADLGRALNQLLPRALNEILEGIYDSINKKFGDLIYLGPLRSYPERHAFAKHNDPNWKAGGGYGWEIVRDDESVRGSINAWLGNEKKLKAPYQLEVRTFIDTQSTEVERIIEEEKIEIREDVDSNIDEIIQEIGVSLDNGKTDHEVVSNRFNEYLDEFEENLKNRFVDYYGSDTILDLVLVDKRSDTIVSHRDVGIGISQVLPVLAYSYSYKNKIILIEQPELHLHPALAAELADVFIETAIKNQNTFILETHSEHLILRIMRRIRESFNNKLPDNLPRLSPDDVSIIYVEPDGSQSIARELTLNKRGEFTKSWPGGFFDEGFNEVFS